MKLAQVRTKLARYLKKSVKQTTWSNVPFN